MLAEVAATYSRQGWAEPAAQIREQWQAGHHDPAASLATDEVVPATTLIGTETMVRQRLTAWRLAGVNTVRLYPAGATLDARLTTLARAIELVRETETAPYPAGTRPSPTGSADISANWPRWGG